MSKKPKKSQNDDIDVTRMQQLLVGVGRAETPPEEELPDFPPPRGTALPELTPESRKILNAHRKARAMGEAREVGEGLFKRAPLFLQKQLLQLIAVIDSLSQGHPKMRNKIIGEVIAGVLHAARVWIREQEKIQGKS